MEYKPLWGKWNHSNRKPQNGYFTSKCYLLQVLLPL